LAVTPHPAGSPGAGVVVTGVPFFAAPDNRFATVSLAVGFDGVVTVGVVFRAGAVGSVGAEHNADGHDCLLYTSPSPRDRQK